MRIDGPFVTKATDNHFKLFSFLKIRIRQTSIREIKQHSLYI